jgi:hypothetical protein
MSEGGKGVTNVVEKKVISIEPHKSSVKLARRKKLKETNKPRRARGCENGASRLRSQGETEHTTGPGPFDFHDHILTSWKSPSLLKGFPVYRDRKLPLCDSWQSRVS